MANVSKTIDIAAPVQHVWDVAIDLERLGEWVSIHHEFPTPPPSSVSQGTRFSQKLAVAGTPFSVEWTAVEVDGPSRITWEGTGPAGTTARTSYALAAEGEGTRFTYENEFKLPAGDVGEAAAKVVSGRAAREVDDSLARLKALAEA